ncbi:hypothetical protein HQQ81_02445 [Microbacteriaceae bacterium VKM Ac-2854]|nr:hypothetical protein [Microbacteriaceae bacterium VKM Ac-2854]
MGMAARFDVRDFARTAHGSLRAEFDRSEFESFPLDREAIIATAYLRALERGAVDRARRHPAPETSRIGEFLVPWALEKNWIADALDEVLDASPHIRIADDARRPRRLRSMLGVAGSILLGADLASVQAALSAIDAHVMMRGYQHLAHLSLHPEMERLAAAIVPILERHADFFVGEAAGRLSSSLRARSLARVLIHLERLPSGEGELPSRLAAEGRSLVFGRDLAGLALIDLALSRRLGVPISAATRLAVPARSFAERAARRVGATAAEFVWATRRAGPSRR